MSADVGDWITAIGDASRRQTVVNSWYGLIEHLAFGLILQKEPPVISHLAITLGNDQLLSVRCALTVVGPQSNSERPERDEDAIAEEQESPVEPISAQGHADIEPEKSAAQLPEMNSVKRHPPRPPWTRRNFFIAAGTLAVGAVGLWYPHQTNEREEEKEAREREKHNYEFPPQSGPAVQINRVYPSDWTPNWELIYALPKSSSPEDFLNVENVVSRIIESGGAWCGRMAVWIVLESLRRSVIIHRVGVEVRRLGPPMTGTLYRPLAIGGGAEESEYLLGGVNLDAPRPTVRSLDEEFIYSDSLEEYTEKVRNPLPLGVPFPGKQVLLGPHDQVTILIEAEARNGSYEWWPFLELLADGEGKTEKVTAPLPLRVTAPADSYSSVLREEPDDEGNFYVVPDVYDNLIFWR